jgi:AcrR family transcriptional regulator
MVDASSPRRRDQILSTASRMFAEYGFHGVSVDDLGAAVGVSGPALYRHFRCKEDILADLLLDVSRRLLTEGTRRVESAPDSASALDLLVTWHVDFALDNPAIITVQARELASLPTVSRQAVRSLQRRYVNLWANIASDLTGSDRKEAVAAVHAVFGLVNSTPHSARLPRQDMSALLRSMALASLHALPIRIGVRSNTN